MILILLAIIIVALALLAIASVRAPRHVVVLGTVGISGFAVLLLLFALLVGDTTAMVVLPIGPAGGIMHLSLDPLGAAFLLLLFLAAVPCVVFAGAEQQWAPESLAGLPGSLAAIALVLLAEDAFTLALALGALGVAGWLLLASSQEANDTGRVATSYLSLAVSSAVCLIAALALMAPPAVPWLDCDYAAIRSAPPEGWRAGVALLLTIIGAACLAGLAPLHLRIRRFGSASALLVGAGAGIGIYLLFRVLLDLSGSAQPVWWGVVLIVVGSAPAVLGPLREAFATDLGPALAIGSLHQAGTAVIALGVALLARAADLPQVASLALAAAWLQLVTLMLCRTLLLLCADAVQQGAATRRLDRLGGLIHRMPVTSSCVLAGLFGTAMLPPGLGFAGFWLLFQSLLGSFVIGGFGLRLIIALAVLVVGSSLGIAAISAVRVAGVALLGRPRTPRAAVAEEVPLPLRLSLLGLAGLTGVLAVLPGLALLPAAQGLARLAGGPGFGMALVLKAGPGAPGYAVVPVALFMALMVGAMLWLSRRLTPGHRREPIWSGGFSPPPPWLPFGDPAAQASAISFTEALRRLLRVLPGVGGTLNRILAPLRDRLHGAAERAGQPSVQGSVVVTLAVLVLGLVLLLVTS